MGAVDSFVPCQHSKRLMSPPGNIPKSIRINSTLKQANVQSGNLKMGYSDTLFSVQKLGEAL
jgi:hypothetical protein